MAYTLVPTELIVDGAVTSAKLDTNISISGTLGVTGELTLSTHMIMGDNDKIKIGTGGDLEIYHDGSNSYISNSTGNIYLADTNGSVHIQAKLNEESIVCTADGAVTLYHDNAVKLATSSAGVSVTGTVTADGLIVDGNNDIQINRDGVSAAKIFWNRSGTTDAFLEVDSGENLTLAVDEAQLGSRLLLLRNNQTNVVSVSSSGIDVTGTVTADGLIVDTSTLVVDSTNNRVGIGTTSPAGSGLHIRKDTLATTNELLRLSNSAGSTTDGVKIVMEVANTSGNGGEIGVVRDSGSFVPYMFFSTSSGVGSSPTEAMRIDSDARLAINNTTSAADSNINDQVKLVCGGGVVVGSAAATNNSFLQYTDAGGLTVLQGSGSYGLRVFDDNSTTPRFTVMRSGNVGVGVNDPEKKLEVKSDTTYDGILIDVLAAPEIRLRDRGNSDTLIGTGRHGLDGFHIDTYSGNALFIRGSDRQVGIGTSSPQELIHAYSSSSTAIRASGGANNNKKVEIGYDNTNGPYLKGGSSGIIGIQFYVDNTTLAGKFDTNADFYTNDGTVHSLSDSRVKTDINDLVDGLDVVKQLQPKTFKYNEKSEFYNEETKDEVRYGFIADEVQEVAPQYMQVGKGKIDGVEVDDLKSLSTTKMIPMLVKAIQEQQTIIDDLKSRIETLENE